MSLPFADLGSLKVSQEVQSVLAAKAKLKRTTVVALVREIVESYINEELHVFIMASEIHETKGFGKLSGGSQ